MGLEWCFWVPVSCFSRERTPTRRVPSDTGTLSSVLGLQTACFGVTWRPRLPHIRLRPPNNSGILVKCKNREFWIRPWSSLAPASKVLSHESRVTISSAINSRGRARSPKTLMALHACAINSCALRREASIGSGWLQYYLTVC